ncbi:hypothetical protein FisN_1Hh682 [Fistulifera solaris]|uniref:Cardiolipin synthase N-terminal domain-containing protein n=1 Tax=Fistulifera solaris TaxID=1519565 RepID=A0A1Z5JML6_FISSO|nr:hypothetical protein FisN_1Hh682 [Fistulifera solaris]|eukprot:GAX15245.1 hypothetical protein FisN_1Hh682 [Fistulifera solaris]
MKTYAAFALLTATAVQAFQIAPTRSIAPKFLATDVGRRSEAPFCMKARVAPEIDADDVPSSTFNPIAAVPWVSLVSLVIYLSGDQGLISASDQAMIEGILADPANPGFNELFYMIFNFFVPMPMILAALLLPQGRPGKGLPAGPFLCLSSFIGYFALGPYLTFRAPPRDSVTQSELSWFTAKVTENKLLGLSLAAAVTAIPFLSHVPEAFQTDASGLWQGFLDLLASSKFALVSSLDLTCLHLTAVALTARDYRLRTGRDGTLIAASTLFLPLLGSSIYLALRPPIPEE